MSQVTLCDICGSRVGLSPARLVIASPVHPHKADPIHDRGQTIDICASCLVIVPDLKTDFPLEDLQHVVARRRSAIGED
jgi:hypothetical protein